jgi:Zn-dependent protease with chaperone function
MKRFALAGLAALAACVTNPYTGRDQFLLTTEEQEVQLGVQGYQEVLSGERLSKDPRETEPVRKVGQRIAAAAKRADFRWEFNTIVDDETVNAWCMPGGKIAFYTGIFPALKDEAGMAFVMGHEVSHALLRHGGERISQNLAAEVIGGLLAAGIGGKDEKKQALVLGCFGLAAGLGVLLPFSRSHESEADALGLKLMAQAGYDPRQGVEVWRRMAALGGGGTPEFLSTHPSHETRIADLEARMPEALAIYEKSARAPVAVLPGTQGRKGAPKGQGAAFTPAGKSSTVVEVRAGASKRGRLEDGRAAAGFEFAFGRDVYLHEVRTTGPGGLTSAVAAKQGIAAGEGKSLTLVRQDKGEPELPPGRYVLTFVGTASGEAFTTQSAWDAK